MNHRIESTHSETLQITRDPFSGAQIEFGVMGSAGGDLAESNLELCRELGRAIARNGCCLLTGACRDCHTKPYSEQRMSTGMSSASLPAMSLKEHVETFDSPYKEYDVLILLGWG